MGLQRLTGVLPPPQFSCRRNKTAPLWRGPLSLLVSVTNVLFLHLFPLCPCVLLLPFREESPQSKKTLMESVSLLAFRVPPPLLSTLHPSERVRSQPRWVCHILSPTVTGPSGRAPQERGVDGSGPGPPSRAVV
jgi:hypothetical protein